MKKEIRTTCFDNTIGVETYCLEGVVQPFPNHLHEYYVIGYMVSGQRYLSCKNKEYHLKIGDLVLFNPGDNHNCAQLGNEPFPENENECNKEMEVICRFLEEHFTESISLEELCNLAGVSKSSLLRSFTKEKGMTPYRYLQSIRINAARILLE